MKATAKDYKLSTKKQNILSETLRDKAKKAPVWIWGVIDPPFSDERCVEGFGLASENESCICWIHQTSKKVHVDVYDSLGVGWFVKDLHWEELPEDELYKLLISTGVDLTEFQQFQEKHTYDV